LFLKSECICFSASQENNSLIRDGFRQRKPVIQQPVGSLAWEQERFHCFNTERSALVRFALELQALLEKVKGKLRNTYSESDFDSSDDDDDDVEQWMKDIEFFLEQEQAVH
jgi:hypothetical protein